MPCVTIAFEPSPGETRTSFAVMNAHRDAWKIKVNSDNWIVKHLAWTGIPSALYSAGVVSIASADRLRIVNIAIEATTQAMPAAKNAGR
jgi:hypothetical protein